MPGDGIGIVPFSPLGHGMLTGRITSFDKLPEQDMRRTDPRSARSLRRQPCRRRRGTRDAAAHGATPGQVALAWLLAKGSDVVPIPGTKRITYLEENLGAVDVDLTGDDLARLDTVSVVGERWMDPNWVYRTTPPLKA